MLMGRTAVPGSAGYGAMEKVTATLAGETGIVLLPTQRHHESRDSAPEYRSRARLRGW